MNNKLQLSDILKNNISEFINELERVHKGYLITKTEGRTNHGAVMILHSLIGSIDLSQALFTALSFEKNSFSQKNAMKFVVLQSYEQTQSLTNIENEILKTVTKLGLEEPASELNSIRKKHRKCFKYINSLSKIRNVAGHFKHEQKEVIDTIEGIDCDAVIDNSIALVHCASSLVDLQIKTMTLIGKASEKLLHELRICESPSEREIIWSKPFNRKLTDYILD